MSSNGDALLAAAVKAGQLSRYTAVLERGEQNVRRLWICPDVAKLLQPGFLIDHQRRLVDAAFRRFIVGGLITVVTRGCAHPQAAGIGDIRELKVKGPIFVEFRFKPPRHHLRVFGRFIGKDDLLLTTAGQKLPQKPLSIPIENALCKKFFTSINLDPQSAPSSIRQSISNAKFQ